MVEGLIGAAIGFAIAAFLANRKPQWFASVTRLEAIVESKIKGQ